MLRFSFFILTVFAGFGAFGNSEPTLSCVGFVRTLGNLTDGSTGYFDYVGSNFVIEEGREHVLIDHRGIRVPVRLNRSSVPGEFIVYVRFLNSSDNAAGHTQEYDTLIIEDALGAGKFSLRKSKWVDLLLLEYEVHCGI